MQRLHVSAIWVESRNRTDKLCCKNSGAWAMYYSTRRFTYNYPSLSKTRWIFKQKWTNEKCASLAVKQFRSPKSFSRVRFVLMLSVFSSRRYFSLQILFFRLSVSTENVYTLMFHMLKHTHTECADGKRNAPLVGNEKTRNTKNKFKGKKFNIRWRVDRNADVRTWGWIDRHEYLNFNIANKKIHSPWNLNFSITSLKAFEKLNMK